MLDKITGGVAAATGIGISLISLAIVLQVVLAVVYLSWAETSLVQ